MPTVAVFFLIGTAISIITILAGLFAGQNERGKILGLIGMTAGLGGIIGGLSIGLMVDRWGYPTMFLVLCLYYVALPVTAIFVKDKQIERVPEKNTPALGMKPNFRDTNKLYCDDGKNVVYG